MKGDCLILKHEIDGLSIIMSIFSFILGGVITGLCVSSVKYEPYNTWILCILSIVLFIVGMMIISPVFRRI